MNKIIIYGVFGIIISSFSYSYELNKPKKITIKYLHNYGSINGFIQIPKGGQFGSTTDRKPEFNELGIDNINYPNLEVNLKWDNLFIYSGVNYNTFKGRSTLDYDLVSQCDMFYS